MFINIYNHYPHYLNPIMATKKVNVPLKEPDALIISKSEFTSKLLNRIEIGQSLYDKIISTVEQLEAHSEEYYKWDSYNSELLKNTFNNESNSYKISYDHVNFSIFGGGSHPEERLIRLKQDIKNKVANLQDLLERVDLLKSEVETTVLTKDATQEAYTGPEVFIVHGHNTDVLNSVARTVERLGLKPIILHEQPNAGKTLIEKFEEHSNVGFSIILLTDDDEGKAKTQIELNKRARQNVILELGYFIGKLGRPRVLPLYSAGVELPSDIYGLVYVPIDGSGNWKFAIVKELKAAGYAVDANNIL